MDAATKPSSGLPLGIPTAEWGFGSSCQDLGLCFFLLRLGVLVPSAKICGFGSSSHDLWSRFLQPRFMPLVPPIKICDFIL